MQFLVIIINFVLFSLCTINAINVLIENSDSLETTEPTEPSEFIKIGSNYYWIEDTIKVNWFEAANICRSKGTYLATFKTQEDANAITAYLEAKEYEGYFWLGSHALGSDGEFHWIDTGLPLQYTNWGINQPDNAYDGEDCMQFWNREHKYLWNDNDCYNLYGFMCKAVKPETFELAMW